MPPNVNVYIFVIFILELYYNIIKYDNPSMFYHID